MAAHRAPRAHYPADDQKALSLRQTDARFRELVALNQLVVVMAEVLADDSSPMFSRPVRAALEQRSIFFAFGISSVSYEMQRVVCADQRGAWPGPVRGYCSESVVEDSTRPAI